jgi:hypothetical protein
MSSAPFKSAQNATRFGQLSDNNMFKSKDSRFKGNSNSNQNRHSRQPEDNSFKLFKNAKKMPKKMELLMSNNDLFPSLSGKADSIPDVSCNMNFTIKVQEHKKKRKKKPEFIPPGWIGLKWGKNKSEILVHDRSSIMDDEININGILQDRIRRLNREIAVEVEIYGKEYFFVYPNTGTSCHHNHFVDYYG